MRPHERIFIGLAAEDFDAFRAFANAADVADNANAAALKYLGYPVKNLRRQCLGRAPGTRSRNCGRKESSADSFSAPGFRA